MVGDLPSYSTMMNSGLDWLGDIPNHWKLRRTKTLLVQRVEKGHPDEPLLAATQTKGVVRKEQYKNRTVVPMKDLHLLKLVHTGDFVISLRSFQGGIEYAREQGIISPAYTVLYPAEQRHHGYLAKLFKSTPYVQNLTLFVTGIRQGQNIDYERLSRSRLPLPPISEQRAIVRFLDHADRRIKRYIRAKERLIELLEEQKQAIIHQAVTGQIDVRTGQSYPAYKDSGVEWLGEVPKHWEVDRLKGQVANIIDQTKERDPNEAYIALEHVESWTGKLKDAGDDVEFDSQVKRFRVRDVLFGKLRPYLAKVTSPNRNGVCVGEFLVLRCRDYGFMSNYLEYSLRSKPTIDAINASTFGAKMPRADWNFIGSMRLPVPSSAEQTAIAHCLDSITASIDQAIAATRKESDLLREYRTRLIADVVTGKLDVREAAAALPDTDSLVATDLLKDTMTSLAELQDAHA